MAKRDAAQGLVEYCLILILVAVVVMIAVKSLGTSVKLCYFEPVQSSLSVADKP